MTYDDDLRVRTKHRLVASINDPDFGKVWTKRPADPAPGAAPTPPDFQQLLDFWRRRQSHGITPPQHLRGLLPPGPVDPNRIFNMPTSQGGPRLGAPSGGCGAPASVIRGLGGTLPNHVWEFEEKPVPAEPYVWRHQGSTYQITGSIGPTRTVLGRTYEGFSLGEGEQVPCMNSGTYGCEHWMGCGYLERAQDVVICEACLNAFEKERSS